MHYFVVRLLHTIKGLLESGFTGQNKEEKYGLNKEKLFSTKLQRLRFKFVKTGSRFRCRTGKLANIQKSN